MKKKRLTSSMLISSKAKINKNNFIILNFTTSNRKLIPINFRFFNLIFKSEDLFLNRKNQKDLIQNQILKS